MKYAVVLFLYLFFFIYRFIYWGTDDFPIIILNSLNDTLISYFTAKYVYQLVLYANRLQKTWLILFSVLIYGLGALILWGLHYLVYEYADDMSDAFRQSFFSMTFQFFDVITLLLVGTAATYAWIKNLEAKSRKEELNLLLEEKRNAELKFLKSQINPHFIFNTLNAINFSIDKSNTKARELVSDFADLFRFQLYESDQDSIEVEKELHYIEKYIQIHRIRLEDTHEISMEVEGDLQQKKIPPLLLIPFIENAIKHSSSALGVKTKIHIHLKADQNYLILEVSNSVLKKTSTSKNGGLGLKNVQKRMDILFQGDYELGINELDSSFAVKLKIPMES